jgi:hypothetical protein
MNRRTIAGVFYVLWILLGAGMITGRLLISGYGRFDGISYRASRTLPDNHLLSAGDLIPPPDLAGELACHLPGLEKFQGRYLVGVHEKGQAIHPEEVTSAPHGVPTNGGGVWAQALDKWQSQYVDAGESVLLWSADGQCLAAGKVESLVCVKEDCQALIPIRSITEFQLVVKQKTKPVLTPAEAACPATGSEPAKKGDSK